MKQFKILTYYSCLFVLVSCGNYKNTSTLSMHERQKLESSPPTYTYLKDEVFQICRYCHTGRRPYLFNYQDIQAVVVPGKPEESKLFEMVSSGRMPKGGRLSNKKIWAIYYWIKNGAKND